MCGIAGIIGNRIQTPDISNMLQRISHRGPNGLFTWEADRVAFAHARLSIIDLSSDANQPMTDPVSGNVIIFNGEIYNYIELKKEIGNRYPFRTTSDTEVILAAYLVFGAGFLNRLRGMFALAIYDQAERFVMIARDRIGIKPLYYRQADGQFRFASEIKALLSDNMSEEAINEPKAFEFLTNCQLDTGEQTLFQGILQLPPAHFAKVSLDGNMGQPVSYWSFPEPGRKKFDQKAKNEFVGLFDETIKLYLRSDVPVGTFLSGGIDSTSVTCFAAKNISKTESLHTFSALLPYHHPENALIGRVLETDRRLVPHHFPLDGKDFFQDMPAVIYHHDEPVMDGSMYAHYKLCQQARDMNIRVLLSGSGGDELFGGYASYLHAFHASLIMRGKMKKFLGEVREASRQTAISYQSLLVKGLYENLPVSLRRNFKNRQIRDKFSHVTVQTELLHYFHHHKDPYHANLLNNYKSWTAPPFLHYEDRNSMAHGVEVRVPFFDHQLIEYILQFDPEGMIKGRTKSAIRDSFRGIVPDFVLDQKGKYGFPSPIDHMLRDSQQGRELFHDFLSATPLLDIRETKKLGEKFYNNQGDLSVFWRVLSYMIWYQVFFKGWKGFIAQA